MGNCLTCFKEPAAPDTPTYKEEMPDAHLFPAPSHTAPGSAPPALTNGNASPRARPPPKRRPPADHPKPPADVRLHALFDLYRDDAHADLILAEGVERLCLDLQIPPDDFRVLVLAWRLAAEQMCRFTRAEFTAGMRTLRADSVRALAARLPDAVAEVAADGELFKDLYRFTFRFGLDAAAGQRILPIEMAVVLWRLVFTVCEPPILVRWLAFLETHQLVRGIPKDTWNMFLNFSEAVGDDLSSYDDTEAWPSLFDDFVEFENDQANQNISKENNKELDGVFI